MRKLLIIIIISLFYIAGFSQSTLPLRADTVKIEKIGGNGELIIKNATRDSLGLLINVGGGRTQFRRAKQLNDSTIIIGLDTFLIRGNGGSGTTITNASATGDTLLTADNKLKRIDTDATITRSTNATKILLGVDTISRVASKFALYDTARVLRELIEESSGSATLTSTRVAFGSGTNTITDEAAFNYSASTNTLNADSVKSRKLVSDSFAILGAKTVIGQLEPSYTWQRNQQWYDDGGYPGIFTVVNTDSVNCIACVPGQALSVSDSTGGRGLVIKTFSESTGGNFIRTMKARGNWKNPTALKSGDILTGLGAWGFGTTEFSGSAAGFHIAAAENFTDAAWGTEIQFFTTPNGTQGRTYNVIMKQDGSSLFGGAVDAPTINLSGTGSRFMTINSTDGGAPFIRFQRSGGTQGTFGTASTTNQFLTGSVANDFVIRAGNQGINSANILFSTDASNIAMKLNTSGQLQLNNVAGTGTRVSTWSSTGVAGSVTNGSNGDVLTIVAGVPTFAAPPGTETLQDVTDNGNTTDNSVVFQAIGTDDDIELKAIQVNDNIGTLSFRAAQGTNSATGIRLMPRGTGFSSTMKANIDLFNTDQEADGTNYEDLRIGATGTTGYIFNSIKAGTGTVRPIAFQTDNTTRFSIAAAGTINIASLASGGTAPTTSGTVKNVIADANGLLSFGNIADPYNKYTALLVQSSTGNPTATVLGTNTVGTIVWTRNSAGNYTGTLTGAFTTNKTWLSAHSSALGKVTASLSRVDANTVTLIVYGEESGVVVPEDDFDNISVEIRVYP